MANNPYTLDDEVIEDLEDCSDTLSELGTSIGEHDFVGSVGVLTTVMETLENVRTYLETKDKAQDDHSKED